MDRRQSHTPLTVNRQDVSEMFDWYKHADKLAYFFIAVAIYLLLPFGLAIVCFIVLCVRYLRLPI